LEFSLLFQEMSWESAEAGSIAASGIDTEWDKPLPV
jgi:hypothetical protein